MCSNPCWRSARRCAGHLGHHRLSRCPPLPIPTLAPCPLAQRMRLSRRTVHATASRLPPAVRSTGLHRLPALVGSLCPPYMLLPSKPTRAAVRPPPHPPAPHRRRPWPPAGCSDPGNLGCVGSQYCVAPCKPGYSYHEGGCQKCGHVIPGCGLCRQCQDGTDCHKSMQVGAACALPCQPHTTELGPAECAFITLTPAPTHRPALPRAVHLLRRGAALHHGRHPQVRQRRRQRPGKGGAGPVHASELYAPGAARRARRAHGSLQGCLPGGARPHQAHP